MEVWPKVISLTRNVFFNFQFVEVNQEEIEVLLRGKNLAQKR
jgi:hypothetical protein